MKRIIPFQPETTTFMRDVNLATQFIGACFKNDPETRFYISSCPWNEGLYFLICVANFSKNYFVDFPRPQNSRSPKGSFTEKEFKENNLFPEFDFFVFDTSKELTSWLFS